MDSEVSSIRDLKPLETGGVVARVGMGLQDHVAAGFCIRMLSDPSVLEVWCERQDDVTLLWSDGKGKERVEFVQVKSTDQAWTPKNLCAGEPSVLERLLAFVKLSAEMDVAEQRLPQDGSFTATVLEMPFTLRVSTLISEHGERMVLRDVKDIHAARDDQILHAIALILGRCNREIHHLYPQCLRGGCGSGGISWLRSTRNRCW